MDGGKEIKQKAKKLACGKPDGGSKVEVKTCALVIKVLLMISFCIAEMIAQVKTQALSGI